MHLYYICVHNICVYIYVDIVYKTHINVGIYRYTSVYTFVYLMNVSNNYL